MRTRLLPFLLLLAAAAACFAAVAEGAEEARSGSRSSHATLAKIRELYGEEVAAALENTADSSGFTELRTTTAHAQRVLHLTRGQMQIATVDHEGGTVVLRGTPELEVLRALQADSHVAVNGVSHLLKLSPVVVETLHSLAEASEAKEKIRLKQVPDSIRVVLRQASEPESQRVRMPWQVPTIGGNSLKSAANHLGDRALGQLLQRAVNSLYPSFAPGPCDFDQLATRASVSGRYVRISGIHETAKHRRHAAECFATLVTTLSLNADVRSVDLVYEAQTLNKYASATVQSAIRDAYPLWKRGLNGTGQVIALGDSGLDLSHCLFRDEEVDDSLLFSTTTSPTAFPNHRKVVQYVAHADNRESSAGHGSHVAGTIAGNTLHCARKEQKFNGIAMGAKLAIFDMGVAGSTVLDPPDDLADMFDAAKVAGARVHVNSWGTLPNMRTLYYSVWDMQVDQYLHENDDMTAIFAVGNCGKYDPVRCDLFFEQSSATFPSTSKNGIGVGAVGSLRGGDSDIKYLKDYSSRGPTVDGRIKPDVVAPASFVFSAKASHKGETCDDIGLEGTSVASGVVGAAAILIQEYFARGYYPSTFPADADARNVSNAVMKAMLVNSAVPIAGVASDGGTTPSTAPDNNQGHGRVTLDRVLPFENEFKLHIIEDVCASTGPVVTTTIQIRSAARPLQVSLVWMDPPGEEDEFKDILINNLDLTLQTGSTTFFPNGKFGADTANNVEKITIPTNGLTVNAEFDINVECDSITQGPQSFAVVITGLFDVVGDTTTFGGRNEDAYAPGFEYPGCQKEKEGESDPTNAVWAAAEDGWEFISRYRGTDIGALVTIILLFVMGTLCGTCWRTLCCPPKQRELMQEKLYMDVRTHKLYAKKPLTMDDEEPSPIPNFALTS